MSKRQILIYLGILLIIGIVLLGFFRMDKWPLPFSPSIDLITPNPASVGQIVSFKGRGIISQGWIIVGYNWRSSIDGQLSSSNIFSTSNLSVGTHTIYFKVQGMKDEWRAMWSKEVAEQLIIYKPGDIKQTTLPKKIKITSSKMNSSKPTTSSMGSEMKMKQVSDVTPKLSPSTNPLISKRMNSSKPTSLLMNSEMKMKQVDAITSASVKNTMLMIPEVVVSFNENVLKQTKLFQPNDVVINSSNIYVVDTLYNKVKIFDLMGNLRYSFGQKGKIKGRFNEPCGIAVDAQGNIYIADTNNNRIQKFDNKGNVLDLYTGFNKPKGIAVDKYGNIYISDTYNHRVVKLDNKGNINMVLEEKFNQPTAIALDGNNHIYVADTFNHKIKKFDAEGRLLNEFSGEKGDKDFNPMGIDIDRWGNIYVSDTLNNRIQKLDYKGNFLISFGKKGTAQGEFIQPIGIGIDEKVDIYVADCYNNRIQKFTQSSMKGMMERM